MSTFELLLIMALALGAGGLVKGVTGMGLPLVAVPALATSLGIAHAVAIVSLPVLVTNIWQTVTLRGELKGLRFLPRMLSAGAAGVLVGVWVLTSVPERALSVTLGLLLILYVGLRLARPDFRIAESAALMLAWPVGFVAGILQGATGISSPVGVTFIHALRAPRRAHIAAVSAMFLVFVIFHIIGLVYAGILDRERFLQSGLAVIPAAATMPLGGWLSARLGQIGFDRAILALLGIIGVQLVASGLAG